MPIFHNASRRLRLTAVTTAVAAGLATGLAAAPLTASAAPLSTSDPLSTLGQHLLTASFDAQDATVRRGQQFTVSGVISTVTQAAVGRVGTGVPADFTLAVTDPSGQVLGTQAVTAAGDGGFSTVVPGDLTAKLPRADEAVVLGLRAVDASYGEYAAADAGAGSAVVAAAATGLDIRNSFVSSVGWVKPGDTYPSRIIVSNPTSAAVKGASVTVSAPAGTTFVDATGPGTVLPSATEVTWNIGSVPAATGTTPGSVTLVLRSRAATAAQLPTIVWRDLSTKATLTQGSSTSSATSHGPKVIPPDGSHDTARYGDRPFPVVPVQYLDRSYSASHSGEALEKKIDDPATPGSTFNLYQEMSLGQLFPDGDVPSAGIASAPFGDYTPDFQPFDPSKANTCAGATVAGSGAEGTPLYPERISNGVYNLPGTTGYYGSDGKGSALIGSLGGVAALQDIDSGCGPTGKIVADAVTLADPEIDYSDFDTDKDGVVDFFMSVFAGCGGNGASQLAQCTDDPQDLAPYDNVWPHSSSLEYYYSDPKTGLPGITTHDQLKDLQGRPLWYTDTTYKSMTTVDEGDDLKVFVRVGPYNLNPETAIDKASVISHEYGHSLGLPDFYSTGSRETYGDWNLMATDKSQNMDAFSRQELGWVVPEVLQAGENRTVTGMTDSKQDTGTIHWTTPNGQPYTLSNGPDGIVHNSQMFVARLHGRQLLDPAAFDTGDKATKSHAWYSGSGNDFGCATNGGGHNLDVSIPGIKDLPAGSTVKLAFKSMWETEWDFDYGFVLTSKDGGKSFTSHPSDNGYTTPNAGVPGNANQNACQGSYDNGLTGSSGSYSAGTDTPDRLLGNYPAPVFLADSYDISDLVGADTPVLRFSYSSDPGVAKQGWFIDDLAVTATTPSGDEVLLSTDLESDGGPSDPRIFNGGCQADNPGGDCTHGWQFVQAGDEASFDHGYYLEMRDRSGFDLDGHGEIDRDPIGWDPGLYLSYTDEAHGYGNAGTDDPPAQSPLDSTPEAGNDTPNLNDAAFTATPDRSTYSDATAEPHVDNYADPSSASGNWEFAYDCLGFEVNSMSGNADGPETSDGDLTGSVTFTMGSGCGTFDYGWGAQAPPPNTPPAAAFTASPTTTQVGSTVHFDASGSTDAQTPRSGLRYSWDFLDGGPSEDATGMVVDHAFDRAGTYTVTLTVTDAAGTSDTEELKITVNPASANQAPTASAAATPSSTTVGSRVQFDGTGSTDPEGGQLSYRWDFDGDGTFDAVEAAPAHRYGRAGSYAAVLQVVDPKGATDTDTVTVTVEDAPAPPPVTRTVVPCQSSKVARHGSWRVVRSGAAPGGTYCDNAGKGKGRDRLTLTTSASRATVWFGRTRHGGAAKLLVDGVEVSTISFRNGASSPKHLAAHRVLRHLGPGTHRLTLVVTKGRAYVDRFEF
jgi:M6 family metalloprotease-like protein